MNSPSCLISMSFLLMRNGFTLLKVGLGLSKNIKNLLFKIFHRGSFINYVTQLGGGGGQPLCYTMMNMVSKMVYYVLLRGGGGQIMFKIALRN